jgi:hypothetical protein
MHGEIVRIKGIKFTIFTVLICICCDPLSLCIIFAFFPVALPPNPGHGLLILETTVAASGFTVGAWW